MNRLALADDAVQLKFHTPVKDHIGLGGVDRRFGLSPGTDHGMQYAPLGNIKVLRECVKTIRWSMESQSFGRLEELRIGTKAEQCGL